MRASDLPWIAELQAACPMAAQWSPGDYGHYPTTVACLGEAPVGLLAARNLGSGEWELLNLLVHPLCRRRGVASGLLRSLLSLAPAAVLLEVRESNEAALTLYERFGFRRVGYRRGYYDHPPEGGIVMRLQS